MDKDRSGIVSRNELKKGFVLAGVPITEQELDQIFENVDDNNSGEIDFSEFVIASIKKETIFTNENIKACFRLFDRDRSGSISLFEFTLKFEQRGISKSEMKNLVAEVDLNGDGEIDIDEFSQILRKMI